MRILSEAEERWIVLGEPKIGVEVVGDSKNFKFMKKQYRDTDITIEIKNIVKEKQFYLGTWHL